MWFFFLSVFSEEGNKLFPKRDVNSRKSGKKKKKEKEKKINKQNQKILLASPPESHLSAKFFLSLFTRD